MGWASEALILQKDYLTHTPTHQGGTLSCIQLFRAQNVAHMTFPSVSVSLIRGSPDTASGDRAPAEIFRDGKRASLKPNRNDGPVFICMSAGHHCRVPGGDCIESIYCTPSHRASLIRVTGYSLLLSMPQRVSKARSNRWTGLNESSITAMRST